MENNKRTTSPWYLGGPYRIDIESNPDSWVEGMMVMSGDPESCESFPIARVTGPAHAGSEDKCDPELLANAEFIVRACNSHDELILGSPDIQITSEANAASQTNPAKSTAFFS